MSASEPITCFIDTNVWLYAFIEGDDVVKHSTARELIHRSEPVISTQVINEVCVNLLRKTDTTEEQIEELVHGFYEKYRVIEPTRSILVGGSQLRQRYSLSFWDGLIISSALHGGVSILYSEDMQDGLLVEGRLQIINPFVPRESSGSTSN
ncbi:MAG: PIN domain-containing protein [Chloroflexota bacterium]|nr:PIN domain-containing protein [Chloroflexota bacterium]